MKLKSIILLSLILFISGNYWATPIYKSKIIFDTIIYTKNCEINIHSEKSETEESKFISIIYKPTIETLNEADLKKIKSDKVYFELNYDEKCLLKSIVIKKKGQLENFNKDSESFRIELFNEINNTKISKYFENKNNGKCENSILSLNLRIE